MAIFAVIKQPGENGDRLPEAVAATYPNAHYDLGTNAWLIAAVGTAKEVSDRLDITTGDDGSAIVLEGASYFARANPAIWTWIKANREAPAGG